MHRRSRAFRGHGLSVAGLVALVFVSALVSTGYAAESRDKGDRPERGIAVYTEYSGLVIPVGQSVRMKLTVENRGRRDENVTVTLARVPKGWKAAIKGGEFAVSGVPIVGEKSRVLTFTAEPDKGLAAGTYTFEIQGATADQALTVSQKVVLTTQKRTGPAGGDLEVTTSYPVLRGQTDSSFEFSLEVNNKADSDRVVNVAAEAPKGWDVVIKPAYATKQITSLRIRSRSSQMVGLEVKPPPGTQAGEYPVRFRAFTDRAQAEARVTVVLTGIYKLDAATYTGRLSLDAVVGEPSSTTLVVRNTGSAINRNIELKGYHPENWKVEFSPERIEALEPGAFEQVEAKITPAAEALVGDYSVALAADGEKSSKTLEMRVTVRAPATWAWIGVGIIVVVIGGLGGLFAWLGRR